MRRIRRRLSRGERTFIWLLQELFDQADVRLPRMLVVWLAIIFLVFVTFMQLFII